MRSTWMLVPVLWGLAACYGGVEPEHDPVPEEERPWAPQETADAPPLQFGQHCPVQDASIQVALEERPDGASLVFRTTGDVEALQERAHQLGRAYARHQERPLRGSTHRPPTRAEGEGTPGDGGGSTDVTVEDLPDGARIVVTGRSPEATEAARHMLRSHYERLRTGACVSVGGSGA